MLDGNEVATTKTSQISFMERVKLWAKIPGTTQHTAIVRSALKRQAPQTIICYTKGPAFDAALFVSGEFACIKNKAEGLDFTVAVSVLQSKLDEITTWVEARWIILEIRSGKKIRIKKESLAQALQKFK